ncbi:sugar phosphate nucleotidyltransferase [Flavobacteriaceae bacterium]|nr:sugar phosphate nucleotidyltransferase [Flavobacteriaceae bacterium]
MTNHLIILAGGASSRMKKPSLSQLSEDLIYQANSRSKALILLNNRPMLDYVLYNAQQAGLQNIYIVIGKEGDLFKTYYGEERARNMFNGLSISYVFQHIPEGRKKPLGTADAVCQSLEQYPELQENQFVVCNCDNLYSEKAFNLLRSHKSPNAFINYDRDALEYSQERIESFALTKVDRYNYLQEIIEKPSASESEKYNDKDGKFRVSMNVFKFDGIVFYPFLQTCIIHPERNEKELPSALLEMIRAYPTSTVGIPLSEHVPDLTGKDDILIMNEYLAKHPVNLHWPKN